MLSKKVVDLLNNQVNKELYSAYLYLDFENYYHDKSLEGFANWYHVQVQEEIAHAQLMMQYLQDNDYSVVLEAINKPNIPLNELSDPLKAGLKHEQYVTELITILVTQRLMKKKILELCSSWIGSSKNKEKKKRMLRI